ncbi:hypothetical protein [Lichenicola sp.]|uniref:hypothetical protein n=1 Tax=Lichenicola sp. TaxID=2804529 RepID=UPI003B00BBFA
MIFRPNTAVRLRATSELLLIDSIDEESATALCRRFGSGGPEGIAEPFPLDGLRENVIRSPRLTAPRTKMSPISDALCRIGLHGWERKTFRDRPLLGDVDGTVCKCCGEIRLDGPKKGPPALG